MKDEPNIEDWKIWPPYEIFYIESLLTLARTAISDYEYLDEFLNKPIAGNFSPKCIVFNSNELNEVTFVFRCYVVNEFIYKTLNREVCIIPIVKEIYRIHNLLVDFNRKGGRLK